jgi:GntR family transcriptional regulator, transcriptional repressor for pyruvate dehydrogenase complex
VTTLTSRRRPKTLALGLVEALGNRIREGQLNSGDKLPTEAAIMAEFEVSRTVVREALSKLQAAGLVETRHGIGTFVLGLGEGGAFRIAPEQMGTLTDVVAVLELRIGLETEAAALAAQRRSEAQLLAMREALAAFTAAAEAGRDAVSADFQFHLEVARATGNPHFEQLMGTLGASSIPRARLPGASGVDIAERLTFLKRVNSEHESIFDAIAAKDPEAARAAMRTHLANSRERRLRAAALAQ